MTGTMRVLSHTPGRARLNVAGLRGNEPRAGALEALLTAQRGVLLAEVNAVTGNLLVHYAVEETTLDAIQAAVMARPTQRPSLHVVSAPPCTGWPGRALPAELRKRA